MSGRLGLGWDGAAVVSFVGACDGSWLLDGSGVGFAEGDAEGSADGVVPVGTAGCAVGVGPVVGSGAGVGWSLGLAVGSDAGVGWSLGPAVGCGSSVGCLLGAEVGCSVGTCGGDAAGLLRLGCTVGPAAVGSGAGVG